MENKVHRCIPVLPILRCDCVLAFIDRQSIIVYDSDVQVTAVNRYGMTHRLRGRRGHDWEGPYVFINNPVEHHHTHARTHARTQTRRRQIFAFECKESGVETLSLLRCSLFIFTRGKCLHVVITSQKVLTSSRGARYVTRYYAAAWAQAVTHVSGAFSCCMHVGER